MADATTLQEDTITPESLQAETEVGDEAHDAIWASMPVVTLRLAESARAPRQTNSDAPCEDSESEEDHDSDEDKLNPEHISSGGLQRPPLEVQRWSVSDSDSEESSSSASDHAGVALVAASDSTGQGLEGFEEDVQELLGMGTSLPNASSDDNYILPTLEDEQRRLQEIIARRQEVQAIAALYSPHRPSKSPKPGAENHDLPREIGRPEAEASGCLIGSSRNAGLLQATPASVPRACGPSALVDKEEAALMLRRLGDRFREGGLVAQSVASGNEAGRALGGAAAKYVAGKSTGGLEELLAGNYAGKDRIAAGMASEAAQQEELWQALLAGDDKPVGSDMLPPPGDYYA